MSKSDDEALLEFIRRHPKGVDEEAIWLWAEVEGNWGDDGECYVDALARLVGERKLSWRLPSGVRDESDKALSAPLIYEIIP